jgi:hypothetical protein
MIGRAYLWGMAANGEAGVQNVLEILRAGIDETLVGLGRASIHDLVRDDVIVPPGFTRGPGGAGSPAGADAAAALAAPPRLPGA